MTLLLPKHSISFYFLLKSTFPLQRKGSGSHWEYPHESEEANTNLSSERSLADSAGPAATSTAWPKREEALSDNQGDDQTGDIWVRGEDQEVRDWALSLRSGSRTPPRLRSRRTSTTNVPDQGIVTGKGYQCFT